MPSRGHTNFDILVQVPVDKWHKTEAAQHLSDNPIQIIHAGHVLRGHFPGGVITEDFIQLFLDSGLQLNQAQVMDLAI